MAIYRGTPRDETLEGGADNDTLTGEGGNDALPETTTPLVGMTG